MMKVAAPISPCKQPSSRAKTLSSYLEAAVLWTRRYRFILPSIFFVIRKVQRTTNFLPSQNPLSPMKSALQNLESSLLKSIKKMPWEKKSIKPINLLESSRLKSIKKMPSKKIIKNYINNLMKQNFYRKFWHEKDIVCYLLHV